MLNSEFSAQFDVLFNNITSNQAPGLDEYEKSVFLTKGQDEVTKNYFLAQSNPKQAGFDGNQKRQLDFSKLMKVKELATVNTEDQQSSQIKYYQIDPRSMFYELPLDSFLIINESVHLTEASGSGHGANVSLKGIRQVVPLSYDEYMRLMSKPYKNPVKNQAWRLITNATNATPEGESSGYLGNDGAGVELILNNTDRNWLYAESDFTRKCVYSVRYIRRPMPIILTDISDEGNNLTIHGYNGSEEFYTDGKCCELDEMIHEEILQRAVELAKIAWTATGQDNVQTVIQAGQRSE